MTRPKLLIDTNIVVDFLNQRQSFYESARLLFIAAKVGEFDLYVTASQVTDILYITSDGGKASLIPSVLERLRGLRTFVEVWPITGKEIDAMLATSWKDPEDALIYQAAVAMGADCLITHNQKSFPESGMLVMDCGQWLAWLREHHGLDYGLVEL